MKNRRFQLLEALRGLAAIYVFVGHLAGIRFGVKPHGLGVLLQFGQEAVILFFLLSGFVIYYSVATKPPADFKDYFARRALRILPIFFVALLLSAIASGGTGELWPTVLMMQDFKGGKPGVWFNPFGGNVALWSLSYEWWFYMMFYPLYTRVSPEKRQQIVVGGSLAAAAVYSVFPNQICLFLIYFSIWWAGVELARAYMDGKRITLRGQALSLASIGALAVFFGGWTLLYKKRHHGGLSFGIHPVLETRHFVCALVILLVACTLTAVGRARLYSVLKPLEIFAPVSYALYVTHVPLVVKATYLDGVLPKSAAIAAYIVVMLVLVYLLEVKMQPVLTKKVMSWVRPRAPIPATVPLAVDQEPREETKVP